MLGTPEKPLSLTWRRGGYYASQDGQAPGTTSQNSKGHPTDGPGTMQVKAQSRATHKEKIGPKIGPYIGPYIGPKIRPYFISHLLVGVLGPGDFKQRSVKIVSESG